MYRAMQRRRPFWLFLQMIFAAIPGHPSINGNRVLGPRGFKGKRHTVVPVSLLASENNEIEVRMTGAIMRLLAR